MPKLNRILPTRVWEEFVGAFRAATGLRLTALDSRGRVLLTEAAGQGACPLEEAVGREKCLAFYRKAAQQAVSGDEPVLFRCPGDVLVFASPVNFGPRNKGGGRLVLAGAPAGEGASEERRAEGHGGEPRRLLDQARLAQTCLQLQAHGNFLAENHAQRQSQITTLFSVASDLAQAATGHEVFALALNSIGVLFDVSDAAVLLCEQGTGSYRVQTAMGGAERSLSGLVLDPDGPLAPMLAEPGNVVTADDPVLLGRLGLPESVDKLTLFPLFGGSRRLGVLALVNGNLSAADEQILRGFAVQLSVALESRRMKEELAERGREAQRMEELTRRFLSCLQPEALFRAILDEARRLTGAQKGSVMMASNGSGELAVKSVSGLSARLAERLRITPGRGIAGTVFSTGQPLVVADVEHDTRLRRRNRPRYLTKSFVSVPISLEGRVVGVLNLSDKISGDVFSEEDLRLLQAVTAQSTLAIERSAYYAQNQELRKISITDALTGLLNRRYFHERLAEELDRATRHGHPLALIMIDIDHFKAYNDANGHAAGDKALVQVGRCLRSSIRAIDVVSRFGGEEFAVILPETGGQGAAEIGERIRREIESLYFAGEETLPGGRLTVSLGVAGFPEDARDLKTLVQRADRALYQAKALGRNRLVACSAPDAPGSQRAAAAGAWTRVL